MYGPGEYGYDNWQPPRQTAFTHGLGGESGIQNGQLMISTRDRSQAESRYYQEKALKDEADLREGRRQDWVQVRNSRAMADQKANEAANGGRTESFFTRPQSEANWAELNGPRGDGPSKYLPDWMKKYNTGETWQGFQAIGGAPSEASGLGFVGGEEGGGGGGGGGIPQGMREASYTKGSADPGGGYQPLISTESGGRIAEYKQQRDGSFSGQIINPYSAFNGEKWRQNTGQMQSTAGGFAGMPIGQQPSMGQQIGSPIPNVRNYGWDSTSGVEQDAFPAPYQMRGDYKSGRFENVTEEGYDNPINRPGEDDWMQTRHQPGTWTDLHTSQLPGDTEPVKLGGSEGTYDDSLPHPDELGADFRRPGEAPSGWNEGEEEGLPGTNDQIKQSINDRAESQMTGDDAKDREIESERQRSIKALEDYSKRGFLPGYRAEDGSHLPNEVSAYGNQRESGKIRRVGEPLVDAGSDIASGAKQIYGRAKDAVKQVFDFDGTQLNEDPRFENVRTNVRSDGKMSREKAMSAGEILNPRDQAALERFKMQQIMEQMQLPMKSQALGAENPQIAMGGGRRDFDEDFQSRTRHEFDPMEAGQIDAQMTGVQKSPRMDNDGRKIPMRPLTHRDVLAQFIERAINGRGGLV